MPRKRGPRCFAWHRTRSSQACGPSSTATGGMPGSPSRTSRRGTSSPGDPSSPSRRWSTPAATPAVLSRPRPDAVTWRSARGFVAQHGEGPANALRHVTVEPRGPELLRESTRRAGSGDGDRVLSGDRGASRVRRQAWPSGETPRRPRGPVRSACTPKARSAIGVSAPRYRTCHPSRRIRRLNVSGAMSCLSPEHKARPRSDRPRWASRPPRRPRVGCGRDGWRNAPA